MAQSVSWLRPVSPNIIAFRLLVGDDGPEGEFRELVTILNAPVPPYWLPAANAFLYEDSDAPTRLYRLISVDTYGNAYGAEAEPISPNAPPVTPAGENVVVVDQNTTGVDALRYVQPNGTPIAGADIRIYTKEAWDLKRFSQVIAMTTTDANGRFFTPLYVPTGQTYIVRFYLQPTSAAGGFGPDTAEIVL